MSLEKHTAQRTVSPEKVRKGLEVQKNQRCFLKQEDDNKRSASVYYLNRLHRRNCRRQVQNMKERKSLKKYVGFVKTSFFSFVHDSDHVQDLGRSETLY